MLRYACTPMNVHKPSHNSVLLQQRLKSTVKVFLIVNLLVGCVQVVREQCIVTSCDQKKRTTNYATDELLIKFMPGTDLPSIQSLNKRMRVEVLKALAGGQVYLVKIPAENSLEDVRGAYMKSPIVQSVELNFTAAAQ